MKIDHGCHQRSRQWRRALLIVLAMGALPGVTVVWSQERANAPSSGTTEPTQAIVPSKAADAKTADRAGAASEVADGPRGARQNVFAKVYNVADLVIPVPSAVRAPKLRGSLGSTTDARSADFDTLIDRITTTVAPESWDEVGGDGAIESFPTILSLVISQTAEVHRQVAELLASLRRLQDVQIAIETRVLHVPKSALSPEELPGFVVRDIAELDTRDIADIGGPVRLSAARTDALLEKAVGRAIACPKITLFDGQQAQVTTEDGTGVKSTLQYQAKSAGDRRFVFLKVATNAAYDLDELPGEMIPSGDSLLLRIDGTTVLGSQRPEDDLSESSILRKLPRFVVLFKNPPREEEGVYLLLVTPKVITLDE